MNWKTLVKSKTVWGAAGATVAYLCKQDHLTIWSVIQGLGGFLSVVGARDAVAKVTPNGGTNGQK